VSGAGFAIAICSNSFWETPGCVGGSPFFKFEFDHALSWPDDCIVVAVDKGSTFLSEYLAC